MPTLNQHHRGLAVVLSLALLASGLAAQGLFTFSYSSFSWPSGVAWTDVGDFDGDGELDLAAVVGPFELVVFRSIGKGGTPAIASFNFASLAPGAGNPGVLVAGDFDGDGKTDVVVGAPTELVMLPGLGTPACFGTPRRSAITLVPSNGLRRSVAGDIDGDGDLDLVVSGSFASPVRVYKNDGTGLFSFSQTWADFAGGHDLGDLDGDGDLDLATFVFNGGATRVAIHFNDGSGNFPYVPSQVVPVPSPFAGDVALGDVNGDGLLDAAATGETPTGGAYVALLLNGGGGALSAPAYLPLTTSGGGGGRCYFADFDLDGRLDIACWGGNAGQLLYNQGAALPTTENVFVGALTVHPVDADGDGLVDLVLGNTLGLNQRSAPPALVPYPGTPDQDLRLRTSVGGLLNTGPGNYVKSATTGGTITLAVSSPGGTFTGAPLFLGLRLVPTGMPATLSLPGLWFDPFGPTILVNGLASPTPTLAPNGLWLSIPTPIGLTGISAFVQAAAVSSLAANGLYVSTDAHEIILP